MKDFGYAGRTLLSRFTPHLIRVTALVDDAFGGHRGPLVRKHYVYPVYLGTGIA
jgi:hypothetical protein